MTREKLRVGDRIWVTAFGGRRLHGFVSELYAENEALKRSGGVLVILNDDQYVHSVWVKPEELNFESPIVALSRESDV